jgi:hypothetical protein
MEKNQDFYQDILNKIKTNRVTYGEIWEFILHAPDDMQEEVGEDIDGFIDSFDGG